MDSLTKALSLVKDVVVKTVTTIPRLILNFGARDPQYGAVALTNGVSAGPESHGKILQDFDTAQWVVYQVFANPWYPPFMN